MSIFVLRMWIKPLRFGKRQSRIDPRRSQISKNINFDNAEKNVSDRIGRFANFANLILIVHLIS